MQQEKTTPISERALIKRISRVLAKDYIFFHKTREPYIRDLDRYHSVNSNNHICNPGGNDLEEIGRDLGVLKPCEFLQE